MDIDAIFNIIDSYENDDYHNNLLSMINMLPDEDLEAFEKLLKKADEEGKKLKMNESEFEDCWDSISIGDIISE